MLIPTDYMGAATDCLANAPSDPEFGMVDESLKFIVDLGIFELLSLVASFPGIFFADFSSALDVVLL